MKKTLFATLAFIIALAAPAMADDIQATYEKGKALYDKQEYDKAAPYMKEAGEKGHPAAQMHLGKMYFNGWGVGHDHHEAYLWHKKAAEQGNKEAQRKLDQHWDGKSMHH